MNFFMEKREKTYTHSGVEYTRTEYRPRLGR